MSYGVDVYTQDLRAYMSVCISDFMLDTHS